MKLLFLRIKENRFTERLIPLVVLMFLFVIFTLLTAGNFSKTSNIKTIIEQSLIVGTVATGASFIFASGNVNISMGACTALVATIAAIVYLKTESLLFMMLAAVVLGTLLMVASALISTLLHVPVLYVTVVMMTLLASIQQAIIGSSNLTLPFAVINSLTKAHFMYYVFAVFFVSCIIIFHFTGVGRKLRALGTNRICAELTGFFYNKYLALAFFISGIGVGLGALMIIVRSGSISQDTAKSMNMDCMMAIVIGGMPIFGGSKSNTYSAIIGALTVTILNNGLLMVGVSSNILQAIRGIIFLTLIFASQTRPKGLPVREG